MLRLCFLEIWIVVLAVHFQFSADSSAIVLSPEKRDKTSVVAFIKSLLYRCKPVWISRAASSLVLPTTVSQAQSTVQSSCFVAVSRWVQGMDRTSREVSYRRSLEAVASPRRAATP
jgi:hypothetical protein